MKILKISTLFLFIALFTTQLASAQTADEIVENYFKVTGGKDKWLALKTITIDAKASQMGQDLPITIYNKLPNKIRMEINVQGQKIVQAYDGAEVWMTNPMTGGQAQKIPADNDQAKSLRAQAESENALLNYQDKGHKIELSGAKSVEGTDCHEVKLTKKDGAVETYYFSKDTGIIVMQSSISTNPQMSGAVETYLNDYKEVGGLFVPLTIEQKFNGNTISKIVFEKYTINEAMDDKMFAFPTN
jgi:outer membrane lipoprotein-sorting protein